MKRKLTKIWGVGLTLVLMVSLLVIAAPASAADPLQWNPEVLPGAPNQVLVAGSDILDFAIAGDGTTVYAVGLTRGSETATATVTTILAGGVDTFAEVFVITYTNEEDVAARAGTVTLAENAAALVTAAVALQVGDTGIKSIQNITSVGSDVTSGLITITGDTTGGAGLATYTITGAGAGTFAAVTPIADTTRKVYKSVNAGRHWVDISAATGLTIGTSAHVAIAPDDPNIVVITDAVSAAWVTTNGGSSWSSLGAVADFGNVAAAVINDVTITPQVPPGIRYVLCAGRVGGAAANTPRLYYFDLGAASPDWRDATTNFGLQGGTNMTNAGEDTFWSVTASPNFSADYTAVAISESQGAAGTLNLHVISFNQKLWDILYATGYPVAVETGTLGGAGYVVAAADVVLAPDYVGSDDVSRVAFVASAALDLATQVGGIYRCNDSQTPKDLKGGTTGGTPVNSVDFDGTNLVAGAYDTNLVWRSADPLASVPTVVPSRSNKRIGIDDTTSTNVNDATIVTFNGEEVLGAKRGSASAFSASGDNGMSWNDISLMDSAITNIRDIYVTPDGSKVFFTSDDNYETSLFSGPGAWERVLTVANANAYLLRGAPASNDSLYVVDNGATAIFYTADAGENRWYTRAAPAAVTDLTVESADVCYIGTGTTVRKSTNSGFTWGPPETPEISGGAVATLLSLGEDKVIAGGATGFVSYSTDGNASWQKTYKPIVGGATNVQVIASGLATGDYIYAASNTAGNSFYRWTVGDPPSSDWKNIGLTAVVAAADQATGIAYVDGGLYILTADATGGALNTELQRCLNPGAPAGWEWSAQPDGAAAAAGTQGNLAPSALKVTTGKVWYVNTTGIDTVRSYIDTVAATGPALIAPADGHVGTVNTETGRAYPITFNWGTPSVNADCYDIEFYTDAAGDNRVFQLAVNARVPTPLSNIGPLGTNAFEFVTGETYYWRVRMSPRNPAATFTGPIYSVWSEMRSLTIEPGKASVPTVASPENGGTASATPAFSWGPVVGATKYEFQLSADASFASPPLASVELATTGIQPAVNLDAGTTYFWRVRSIEPTVGSWSTIANFTVALPAAPPAPPVVIPPAPAPIVNIPPIEVPAPIVNIPPAPAPTAPISQGLLLAIIIIGAILVIAVIVLIVRTRRTV